MTSVTCQQAFLQAQKLAHQHTHKAVDDRRDAGEGLGGVLDRTDDPFISGVFGQIDGRAHAQRHDDHDGRKDDIERVENVRQDADVARQIARRGGKQLPRDVRHALGQNVDDQKCGQRGSQSRREPHQTLHQADVGASRRRELFAFHAAPPLSRLRKKFRVALMSMINRNSTSAMENSACRCKPLE